jgi:hypothetical protein
MKSSTVVLAATLAVTGCAINFPTPPDLYSFYQASPRSILVLPPANHSLDVDAPAYMLTTLTVPLAEKGFYVFPVNTTKVVLEQEGFYEGDQIQQQPAQDLAQLFGADAVLYITINRWDAQYVVLSTMLTVDVDYRIVYRDGTELWKAHKTVAIEPKSSDTGNPLGNLIASAINAAMTRAKPDYMPLARQANQEAFVTGLSAIPDGPYKPPAKR